MKVFIVAWMENHDGTIMKNIDVNDDVTKIRDVNNQI